MPKLCSSLQDKNIVQKVLSKLFIQSTNMTRYDTLHLHTFGGKLKIRQNILGSLSTSPFLLHFSFTLHYLRETVYIGRKKPFWTAAAAADWWNLTCDSATTLDNYCLHFPPHFPHLYITASFSTLSASVIRKLKVTNPSYWLWPEVLHICIFREWANTT